MRSRHAVAALVLDVAGSAVALILLAVHWQTVRIVRPAPFGPVTEQLAGRTLQPAAFALALVTLAGAVAALATRGVARRVVGALVTAAGVGTVVTALFGLAPIGAARARGLVAHAIAGASTGGNVVPLDDGAVTVATQPAWPVLAAVAALLTIAAGVLWLLAPRDGVGSGGLGTRYEAPRGREPARDATWWSALDHGEDPTAGADTDLTATEHDPDTDQREPTSPAPTVETDSGRSTGCPTPRAGR